MLIRAIGMPDNCELEVVSNSITTRNNLEMLTAKINDSVEIEIAGVGDGNSLWIEYLPVAIREYLNNVRPIALALGNRIAEPVSKALKNAFLVGGYAMNPVGM